MQDIPQYILGMIYMCSAVAELDSQALVKLRVRGCFLAAVASQAPLSPADFNGQ